MKYILSLIIIGNCLFDSYCQSFERNSLINRSYGEIQLISKLIENDVYNYESIERFGCFLIQRRGKKISISLKKTELNYRIEYNYNDKFYKYKSVWLFDSNRNPKTHEMFNRDNELEYRENFEYDSKNRIVIETKYLAHNGIVRKEPNFRLKYDYNDSIINVSLALDSVKHFEYIIDSSSCPKIRLNPTKINNTVYDNDCNVLNESYCNGVDSIFFNNTYNNFGNLISIQESRKTLNTSNLRLVYQEMFYYDGLQRVSHQTLYNQGKRTDVYYSYLDKLNLATRIEERKKGFFVQRKKVNTEIKYDFEN